MPNVVREPGGWFKSSFSAGDSDNCVEVRFTADGTGVRDSKNQGGSELTVDVRRLVSAIKEDRF